MLVFKSKIMSRINGLDLGTDDYIIKTFDFLKLKAKIYAVIRRFNGITNPKIVINFFIINPASRIAKYRITS